MITDFQMLEDYFGRTHAVQTYEDIARYYGGEAIQRAISAGYIAGKTILCGPDRGRCILWLTEKGRCHNITP